MENPPFPPELGAAPAGGRAGGRGGPAAAGGRGGGAAALQPQRLLQDAKACSACCPRRRAGTASTRSADRRRPIRTTSVPRHRDRRGTVRTHRAAAREAPPGHARGRHQEHLHPNPPMFNVVGEIPGTDKADELVMLGAHFDSWHASTGATDNAAGSAAMMEAMRILKDSGVSCGARCASACGPAKSRGCSGRGTTSRGTSGAPAGGGGRGGAGAAAPAPPPTSATFTPDHAEIRRLFQHRQRHRARFVACTSRATRRSRRSSASGWSRSTHSE